MVKGKELESLIVDFVMENKEKYYRLAFQYTQNQQDALDVVQEAVIKAITSKGSLKDPGSIKTWFYRIVANTALDLLRKQNKLVVVDDETMSHYDIGIEDHYEDTDLSEALSRLPVQYRSIIVLRFFEDLKVEDVAKILSENVNTVKTRLTKALNLLRIEMKQT